MLLEPRYTIGETASYLGVSSSTVTAWTRPRADRTALVTALDGERYPIPFVGLAEGLVLAAFGEAGLASRRVDSALAAVVAALEGPHPLAQERFRVEGPGLLRDDASLRGDRQLQLLTVQRGSKRMFHDVIESYLDGIEYEDGIAARVTLPITDRPLLIVDPRRAFGAPIFIRGGTRWVDVNARIRAGEDAAAVAEDFGVSIADVREALALPLRIAA
ncbi:MAG: hypothetical protein WD598_11640 [Acidimicrobiia bacterium]